jgi:hypothetical protein
LETSPKSYRIQLKEKGNIIDTKDKGWGLRNHVLRQ